MILRALVAWLVILLLAVLNGILREAVLLPSLGKVCAYATSGLLLAALVLLATLALARWMRLESARQALGVGALWLALTLVFEFGLGALQGKLWREIVAPYTFTDGNIWPIVLMVVLFAPLAGQRLRR
jgi:hypothetical protein